MPRTDGAAVTLLFLVVKIQWDITVKFRLLSHSPFIIGRDFQNRVLLNFKITLTARYCAGALRYKVVNDRAVYNPLCLPSLSGSQISR